MFNDDDIWKLMLTFLKNIYGGEGVQFTCSL